MEVVTAIEVVELHVGLFPDGIILLQLCYLFAQVIDIIVFAVAIFHQFAVKVAYPSLYQSTCCSIRNALLRDVATDILHIVVQRTRSFAAAEVNIEFMCTCGVG